MRSLGLFEESTLACCMISGKSHPDPLLDFPHLPSKGTNAEMLRVVLA